MWAIRNSAKNYVNYYFKIKATVGCSADVFYPTGTESQNQTKFEPVGDCVFRLASLGYLLMH